MALKISHNNFNYTKATTLILHYIFPYKFNCLLNFHISILFDPDGSHVVSFVIDYITNFRKLQDKYTS